MNLSIVSGLASLWCSDARLSQFSDVLSMETSGLRDLAIIYLSFVIWVMFGLCIISMFIDVSVMCVYLLNLIALALSINVQHELGGVSISVADMLFEMHGSE